MRQYDKSDLRPFQREGVDFLLARPHRLLLDEQGLGKTVEVCAAIREAALLSGLVICPLSAKEQWREHLIEWGCIHPDSIFVFEKNIDRAHHQHAWLICHYQQVLDNGLLAHLWNMKFDVIVCDEAKRMKAITSQTSTIILGSKGPLISRGKLKWALDGTLAPNRPVELYPILKTLFSGLIAPYDDWEKYGNYFCNGYTDEYQRLNFAGASHIDELLHRIAPGMLRRTVEQVFAELPPVLEQIKPISVSLSGLDDTNLLDWLKLPISLDISESSWLILKTKNLWYLRTPDPLLSTLLPSSPICQPIFTAELATRTAWKRLLSSSEIQEPEFYSYKWFLQVKQ